MSNDRGEMLADIADLASDLCDARKHREPYHVWSVSRNKVPKFHETTRPGLLAELHEMFTPGVAEEMGSAGYGSRPPLNVEAASLYMVISGAAFRWIWSLRLELRATVEGNIRALVGAAGTMDSDTQTALLSEMRSWKRRAAIVTGWETAPWRPNVPCPHCDSVNTLVVNLASKSGFCNAWLPTETRWCGAVWDESTIGVLADHVRTAV